MFAEPILHVDMDAFFVEVERLRRPELRGRPAAVGGGGSRGVIASASYEARAFGVRSAMPTVEARRRCPHLMMVPPDHGEYSRVSEAVFGILRDFTPRVEGVSVDEAFLDVSGLRLHFPAAPAVGEAIRARIRSELSLPCSVGVGSSKLVAKLASEAAKPDGLLVVPADSQLEFLHRLPVMALPGVGEATRAALAGLGLDTVGDLAGVSGRALERAVGVTLATQLRRLAAGVDDRQVVPDSEARSISVEETFERDLTTEAELHEALRTQADRVGARLRRAGVVGRTVTVKVRRPDLTTVSRSETLDTPTDLDLVVYGAARRLLDRARPRPHPVRLLGIGVTGLAPTDSPRQLAMGDDLRWSRVTSAVDAVRRRYGAGSVVPASTSPPPAEERPERPDH